MQDGYFDQAFYHLYYRYYTADKNNVIIVLVHGLGEHIGRYAEWAEKFRPYNYAVCGIDLPGHGLSSGKKGHIRRYEDFYDILDHFIHRVKTDFPNKPLVLYGHSMGGNISVNYILDRKPELKAAILSSPWIELAIQPPVMRFWLEKLLYRLFPSYRNRMGRNPDFISRIPEEVEAFKLDPLIHEWITPGLFIPAFYKGLMVKKKANKIRFPLMAFHGTGDMLTSWKATEDFSQGHQKINFYAYPEGYHELHHDLCQNELHHDILDWLSARVIMR